MKHNLFDSVFSRLAVLGTIAFCFILALILNPSLGKAQSWSYPEYDMEGDTIWHSFPPSDSTYAHTELILKFLDGTLNKDSLCYNCDAIVETRTRGKGARPLDDDANTFFAICKESLMTRHFSLDIISDPLVKSILEANGVSYLRRMTAANPCADTLSLSRFGDTIHMDHYNWMIAEFNNDTSVIPTLEGLLLCRLSSDSTVQVAEPNYYLQPYGPRTPVDPQWTTGKQISLSMIGMDDAWNHIGDNAIQYEENINVAVVDAGVDYWRCDLGGGSIPNGKVIGGFDYLTNDRPSVYINSVHGTQVASIIGALTNNFTCPLASTTPDGMAGIAGGFGLAGTPNLGTGVKLVVYNVIENPPHWSAAGAASAILESGALSIYSSYGNGVDVINMSGGTDSNSPNYSVAVRNAMSDAWENGTTFVAANADNTNQTVPVYPSYHEPASEIIAVTGSDHTKSRQNDVAWGIHTDLTAPGGEEGDGSDLLNNISLALQYQSADPTTPSPPDNFSYFGETSAAAPHVSGVAAMLRAWLRANTVPFAREDVEGMLKASALDLGGPADPWPTPPRVDPDGTNYIAGFDDHSGWGFLQAGTLFEMLDRTSMNSYQLAHIEIPSASISAPSWSDASVKSFSNVVVYTATLSTDNIPGSNSYDVKMREVTGTGSYAGLGFNTGIAVYTWGNSGVGSNFGNRGEANLMPNWQEPWCETVPDPENRDLGNEGIVTVWSGHIPSTYTNVGVPGIRHEYSTDVPVHTFQYQLVPHGKTSPVSYLPVNTSDTKLPGLGFTVFGSRSTSGVESYSNSNSFVFWPSIASTIVNVRLDNDESGSIFILCDEIGREVFRETLHPGLAQFDFPVSNLPDGIYLGRLSNDLKTEQTKIIVEH